MYSIYLLILLRIDASMHVTIRLLYKVSIGQGTQDDYTRLGYSELGTRVTEIGGTGKVTLSICT